ncbi:uncharacterized protein LOC120839101 [Ixodes scapularis]|uniref:uncharacterized protein LOC120839101 n=1 Tax=Ixodes scapularis TaxID=6945 RepID=UPI001A9DC95A|nr:uncharacterized protein LOC120839101 [Ixodes scapularis]
MSVEQDQHRPLQQQQRRSKEPTAATTDPMMENLLDKLNSLKSPSNFVKMDLIPSDVKLPVLDIGRLDTRYGPSVFVSLQLSDDIVKVFLPKRFSELSDEELESEFDFSVHYFHSFVHTIWAEGNIASALQLACGEINARLEQYQERGSGFALVAIQQCSITVGRFVPQRAGCQSFTLPKELANKQCILNVNERMKDSERKMCFTFSVLTGLHPTQHKTRASSYRDHLSKYSFPLNYPVTFPEDVETFERKNRVSINVYGYEREKKFVYPLKINDHELEKHVDLLLIDDDFVLITNFAGLFENRASYRFRWDALYFRNTHLMEPFPYFCVYDFEAILKPENTGHVYESHVPSSFCILVIRSTDSRIMERFLYRGEDCVEQFISILNQMSKLIPEWIRSDLTTVKKTQSSASDCDVCGESFDERKRKGNDHFTGPYRLCKGCNLNDRNNKKVIPLVAHNHSLAFLPASLDALVQDLHSKGLENFRCLREAFPQHIELLARKGVFPYDYITDFSVYDEPELPPRESFCNKLNDAHISEKDYHHAQVAFDTFKFKNVGEYSDCYLKLDCLLLSDVMQNFRKWTLETYEIDPLHFVSLPALSLACELKQTKVKLELLSDVDAYLFIESGLRGGIVQCAIRHARANVPTSDSFDPNKDASQMFDLDVNGLYASTMRQPLPYGNFRWLDREEINALQFAQVSDDSPTDYILEVDLDYPEELHDSHADFPLAPEKRGVPFEWLSSYQKALVKKFGLPERESERKLLLTLFPKRNYVIHFRNLKLYLQLGLKLKKIHRVLQFSQRAFLKEFIDFNHDLRKQATNTFQKNLSKLFMNSIYEKTIENPRQYNDIVISVSEDEVVKNLQKPNLRQFTAIGPNVVIFQFSQKTLHLNKPI